MRKIGGIARYTFVEIFRNKVYYILLLFAGALILTTLLLGALGGEQKSRMILDFGSVSIELFSVIVAIFAAVTLVTEEMESRTLYLILTRPIERYQFIWGRFFGLAALMTVSMLIMIAAHMLILLSQHIAPDHYYAIGLLTSWEKIIMIIGVAMVFSLFATSTVSAVTFTFFFWVMGHLSQEMSYLLHKLTHPALALLFRVFYYMAPNFELLNMRDSPTLLSRGAYSLGYCMGYGALYTAVCLVLTSWLFRKKEF